MKNEHMKDQEHSPVAERIKESLHRLHEQDKASFSPNKFDELWNKAEPVRPARRSISPWWLAAACLAGILIGKSIPFEKEKEKNLLAVTDTIRIIERRTDTVFYEKQLPVSGEKQRQTVISSANRDSSTPLSRQEKRDSGQKMKVQSTMSMTEDSCMPGKGKNLSEENFPFDLHVTL